MDYKLIKLFVLLALGIFILSPFINAIVFALVVAYLAMPVYNALNKRLKRDSASAWATMALVFSLILYPTVRGIMYLAAQAGQIGAMFTEFINMVVVPLFPMEVISENMINLVSAKVTATLSGIILSTPRMILQVFIFFLFVYYTLRDGKKIEKYVMRVAKKVKEEKMIKDIKGLLNAIFIGYFEMALVLGVLAYIGFRLMGYSYALILAVIIFIGAMIPIVGGGIVYIPLFIMEILRENYMLAGIIMVFGILLGLLGMYLAPRITATRYRMHPGIMMVGFIGGPMVLGVKGFIIGPIILGILKIAIDYYTQD